MKLRFPWVFLLVALIPMTLRAGLTDPSLRWKTAFTSVLSMRVSMSKIAKRTVAGL